jgi:hypothetical protein
VLGPWILHFAGKYNMRFEVSDIYRQSMRPVVDFQQDKRVVLKIASAQPRGVSRARVTVYDFPEDLSLRLAIKSQLYIHRHLTA